MASDTAPAQPAETKSLSGAQARYKSLEDQAALQQGQQLLTARSLWKCGSHRTKGCPADLNKKGGKDGQRLLC